jgi:hypothetical protein
MKDQYKPGEGKDSERLDEIPTKTPKTSEG